MESKSFNYKKIVIRSFYLLMILFIGLFTSNAQAEDVHVKYAGHVQDIGWMNPVSDGALCGTTGQAKRLEAITVEATGLPAGSGIQYQAHVQDIGWMNPVTSGIAGTEGQSKRVEAFKIQLTGDAANSYDVYYRTHISDIGWLGWAKNFEPAGSEGLAKRMEALEVVIVPKGSAAPGATDTAFVKKASVIYSANVRNSGWQQNSQDGQTSGTIGQGLPIEGLKAQLSDNSGEIQYNVYVEGDGWITPSSNGNALNTSGKKIEAIQFVLAGQPSSLYDVYYRTHVSDIGWMGWAKNGANAGAIGGGKQVEAFEVILTHKEAGAPGDTSNTFQDLTTVSKGATPGLRTVKNFLQTALLPVGQTNYIYGGGWNEADNAAGPAAVYIGAYPQWANFYSQQNSSYNYRNYMYQIYNGLDCSGYVGWAVYNILNTQNNGAGEVYYADEQARIFANKGYGSFTSYGNVRTFLPGDVVSMDNDAHVYIVIGQCADGSVVLAHASPPGVMISGTLGPNGEQTQATQLSKYYMSKYYPDYYNRYSTQIDRSYIYRTRCSKMTWGDNFVGDPDGIRNYDAQGVLQILLGN